MEGKYQLNLVGFYKTSIISTKLVPHYQTIGPFTRSEFRILCNWNLDSGFISLDSVFLELSYGFQSPGFRIPQANIFQIPLHWANWTNEKKYSELNIRCIDGCLLIMAGDCLIHCTVWINDVIPTNRNKWTRIWRAALMPLAFSCAFILFIDTEFSCTKEAYRPWTSKSFFHDY